MESVRALYSNAQRGIRAFSTSMSNNARSYKSVVNRQLKETPDYKIGDVRPKRLWIPKEVSKYPAYPYGEARIFKRSDRGLYGGQVIGFGNKISEMGNHTRRSWLPNVVTKSLWSSSLNRIIKMKLTARVLRTITHEGGLDNYVTKDKEARIKELGLYGWRLRYDILKAREAAARPVAFEIAKKEDGSEVKVYYKGEYSGSSIKLTIGKRKLLEQLFPAVKLNTVGNLKYGEFNVARSNKTIQEILVECESLNVDLSAFTF
ncbi:39S ribosomal protein L24, mitochondrial [Pichia californica]|uniref:Large ribosomal subunit protein bL28m n=1 Tax=Pichia californica TaxID=460514 RepID=A0A9P6WNQ7_9ASCO|nr:39S ribosomal protein L24, mitochondrial [[Candida] californica]KAG0690374.1 39S ribosomal protein L24, mitochondrial [[Candida] californica]